MSSPSRDKPTSPLWIGVLCLLTFLYLGMRHDARSSHADTAAPTTTVILPVSGVLRVAAEPNNLPFSNDKGEGFENKIAELIAHDMGVKLQYVWRAHRRGFIRETLKAGEADVVIGVPTGLDMTLNTAPYYRSTYAFVYRTNDGPNVKSLDDPRLKKIAVGVPLTGESNPPPTQALASRGIIDNVIGFSVYGDYAQPNPTAGILDAVATHKVDVAIAWGPLAGYFADKVKEPLTVVPIDTPPVAGRPAERFAFNMSMGVKRNNKALQSKLNEILVRRAPDIQKILADYHIPRLPIEPRKPQEKASADNDDDCDCH